MHALPQDHDIRHLHAALRYVTDWSLAVDGGAHTGAWTRVMAERFERVHAFEPVPGNAYRIPTLANVTLHRAGLADVPRSLWLVPGPENEGQWHRYTREDPPQAAIEASTVRIDDLELPSCGLLKLDVEGMELHALKGAAVTIETFRPVVVVELNGLAERYGVTDADTEAWLGVMGYDRAERQNKDHIFTPRVEERAA